MLKIQRFRDTLKFTKLAGLNGGDLNSTFRFLAEDLVYTAVISKHSYGMYLPVKYFKKHPQVYVCMFINHVQVLLN